MIVALAERVREQNTRRGRLEQAHTEANHIKATLQELEKLAPKLNRLVDSYELVATRLAVEDRTRFRQSFTELLGKTGNSHANFAMQRQQAATLTKLSSSVEAEQQVLEQAWRRAAEQEVGPLIEILAPLEYLPELQAVGGDLAHLKRQLRDRTQHVPQSNLELKEFDADVQRLRGYLSRVDGLSPDIVSFLRKVMAGTATLADVTDVVVAWSRQSGHAAVFKISF